MEYQGVIHFILSIPYALSDLFGKANDLLGGFGLSLFGIFTGVGLFILLTAKLVRLFIL